MPRKAKITAIPVDAPAIENTNDEPINDAEAMTEVINTIQTQPEADPVAEPVAEPVVDDAPKGMIHPGVVCREKVVCENCGKSMSAKTLKYSHAHTCKSKQSAREEAPAINTASMPQSVVTDEMIHEAVNKRMACAREAKARLREELMKALTQHAV